MQFLLEPLYYEFFLHGLIAAVLIGALCGLIGTHVVLRGMSYVGHGLSHAAFGGAIIGFVLNFNFYVGNWNNGAIRCINDKPAYQK